MVSLVNLLANKESIISPILRPHLLNFDIQRPSVSRIKKVLQYFLSTKLYVKALWIYLGSKEFPRLHYPAPLRAREMRLLDELRSRQVRFTTRPRRAGWFLARDHGLTNLW